jgi:hypothetical protein
MPEILNKILLLLLFSLNQDINSWSGQYFHWYYTSFSRTYTIKATASPIGHRLTDWARTDAQLIVEKLPWKQLNIPIAQMAMQCGMLPVVFFRFFIF